MYNNTISSIQAQPTFGMIKFNAGGAKKMAKDFQDIPEKARELIVRQKYNTRADIFVGENDVKIINGNMNIEVPGYTKINEKGYPVHAVTVNGKRGEYVIPRKTESEQNSLRYGTSNSQYAVAEDIANNLNSLKEKGWFVLKQGLIRFEKTPKQIAKFAQELESLAKQQ